MAHTDLLAGTGFALGNQAAISFNVGGQLFTTLRETLLREASSRLALIARGTYPCPRDGLGHFLLDRDPKHFQLVLNFLRDGWCLLPRSIEERRELLQEVRWYQLTGFEGWLRTQEVLADAGGYSTQEFVAMESPRPRSQYGTATYNSYGQSYQPLASPSSLPPTAASPTRPSLASGMGAGPGPSSAWVSLHGPGGGMHSLGRTSPGRSPGPASLHGPPGSASTGMTGLTGTWAGATGAMGMAGAGGGGGGAGGGGSAVASMREAFLAATQPQRPQQHVAPYTLPSTAEEAASWTSKYLRGNEGLRDLVNTLLELAFVAPHRSLHGGKSHLVISVACGHGTEASLVGSKEDQMRSKLLELSVRGSMGWSFQMTLRPSSDAVLWDKYGTIAAAVQDNWFVLGAILKDQFGVVMEEDSAARPSCPACRRTCLAVTLNKIF
ncbi:hypothetical protein HYH03_000110 [Edaphochlamys debaryana]|uniref:Potassium channel tetramerisation-type BTB domain-containing protein n=1 Tax=Edaphochlamys debaryana TaxID=47281 RepID=A0A835YNA6_9CHLO|nr:hypothetical protein HYH03_000110 [Edaphochlamys debaryana]|eukprot:KAG2501605.1 hypothetical protein HYH03_000110 [Edaphochlamys debaryana]